MLTILILPWEQFSSASAVALLEFCTCQACFYFAQEGGRGYGFGDVMVMVIGIFKHLEPL